MDSSDLAGYRLEALIGRGGMAYVYKAVDERLGRTVALKVLSPELAKDDGFRKRFLRESRMAASIDHPNVIPIYDAGEAADVLYIAMRYVEGQDLKALLASEGQLSADRVLEIFSQVADALDAAHEHGLVHRDVKPANILLAPSTGPQRHEHVYLSDFGVTKRASSLSGVTAPGVIIGTMDYLAPEQIGGKPVTARTDVYALGCVIYQALTGSVPFVRDDDAALLWAHLMETLPPVARSRPDLPPGVQKVLAKATAKDPEDRYASCGEVIAELTAVLRVHHPAAPSPPAEQYPPHSVSGAPHSGPRTDPPARAAASATASGRSPAAPIGVPRRPGRRRLWAMLGAAAVVLALAAAGTFMLISRDPGTTHFAGTATLPVSFDYPANWEPQDDGSIRMVVSPHPGPFLSLFTEADGAWTEVGRLLNDDRSTAVGMYVTFNSTDYTSYPWDNLREELKSLLPQSPDLPVLAPTKAGEDIDALMASGTLSDPSGSARKLSVGYYVVPLSPGQTIHLVFFADTASFQDHEGTFERITKSIGPPD
jgi:serine/threonine protein kinase